MLGSGCGDRLGSRGRLGVLLGSRSSGLAVDLGLRLAVFATVDAWFAARLRWIRCIGSDSGTWCAFFATTPTTATSAPPAATTCAFSTRLTVGLRATLGAFAALRTRALLRTRDLFLTRHLRLLRARRILLPRLCVLTRFMFTRLAIVMLALLIATGVVTLTILVFAAAGFVAVPVASLAIPVATIVGAITPLSVTLTSAPLHARFLPRFRRCACASKQKAPEPHKDAHLFLRLCD
jgi:hypothetical protein